GVDHVQVLRRLMMDASAFHGEVIFTFDGDAAGQKAAQKAYDEQDQKFTTATYVAVEPDGLDPCDLRLRKGDDAVRELVATRVPLFEFAIRSELNRHNLETAEGRVAAMQGAAPKVIGIRDRALRHEYGRRLAGWLGMDVDAVMSTLSEIARRNARGQSPAAPGAPAPIEDGPPPKEKLPRPDPRDPALMVERELLKVALQYPQLSGPLYDALEARVFTAPAYAAVHGAIVDAGGTAGAAAGEAWVGKIRDSVSHEMLRGLVAELAVEPLRAAGEPDKRYAGEQLIAIQVAAVSRKIDALKGKLQRMNPVEETEAYNRQFGEVIALEQYRHGLRERVIDGL
ncbi:MAG TPA: DNA primase, partial [Sporichthya sp.]|nr:DNA primase [Sporichthya sp.]